MSVDATVLRQSVGELEGVQLDVCIPMCQSLDHGRDHIFTSRVTGSDFVAYIEDEFPVLGGQILVSRLG